MKLFITYDALIILLNSYGASIEQTLHCITLAGVIGQYFIQTCTYEFNEWELNIYSREAAETLQISEFDFRMEITTYGNYINCR